MNNQMKLVKHINFRKMHQEDLQEIIAWAAKEGWNPGIYEVEALYAADPKGYYLLEMGKKIIAALAIVRYTEQFSFLGMYIVHPEYRNNGYGKLLWDLVITDYQYCSVIGLNSVREQIKRYEKAGFELAHSNTRWCGKATGTKNLLLKNTKDITIMPPTSVKALIEYDTTFFYAPREAFLSKWLTMPNSHTRIAVKDGSILGYGVISQAICGYKIAPLLANNSTIAECLYTALSLCIQKGSIIFIDTPNYNLAAIDFLRQLGLEKVFDTFRMYKSKTMPTENPQWFGLTSLEIG
jgi:ribosomal protein S18 acetylase RimI-like enzyme